MRVYFNASLVGKERYLKQFKSILQTLRELNCEVYSNHITKRDFRKVNKQTRTQHEADFQKARNEIQKSEVMIVEATYPSIGVGHIMTIALEMYKSILVLYQTVPHGLLIGDPNRLITIKKYSLKNPDKLKHTIKMFLGKAERRLLKKRFNLMIDKIQEGYLDWVSKKQSVSKANFVRQLIDKIIQEDKEYKKIL